MPFPGLTPSTLLKLAALDKQDLPATLQHILRVAADLLQVERVSFWTLPRSPSEGAQCELLYLAKEQAYERGPRITRASSYFAALERELVLDAHDARSDPRTAELGTYLADHQIESLLDVPVFARGKLVGVLCHEQVGRKRQWTAEDQELALSLAQVLSNAYEVRDRATAERAERRASFLSDATRVFSQTLDVEALAERVAEMATFGLGDACVVDLCLDGVLRRVALAASSPTKEAVLRAFTDAYSPDRIERHLSRLVVENGSTYYLPVITGKQLEEYGLRAQRDAVRRMGLQAVIATPLRARGHTLGVLTVFGTSRAFERPDLQLAEEFALRAGTALDNAQLYTEAQRAIRTRDEFLSLAAHELRTPITSLVLAAQVLKPEMCSSKEVQRWLDLMLRQTRRLQRLVELMLDSSQVQLGQLVLQREGVGLVGIVQRVLDSMAPVFERSGCQVVFEHGPEVVGDWDPLRLEQVVTNLLDNAVKFGAGKPLELSVRQVDGRGVLQVRDHGEGIEPARMREVFRRFTRVVSPSNYGGLGLGLYLVRGLVEAHGGRVELQSEQGRGTEVTVRLPLGKGQRATHGLSPTH